MLQKLVTPNSDDVLIYYVLYAFNNTRIFINRCIVYNRIPCWFTFTFILFEFVYRREFYGSKWFTPFFR